MNISGPRQMPVFEALAYVLRDSGVEVVFGLCGSDTVKLGAIIESLGIRYYGMRHESQAVMAADGYSRATNRLGVAMASRGPGFTNALTSMTCSSKAGSSVLLINGDAAEGFADPAVATTDRLDPKHVDQAGLCAAAGVTFARLASADSAGADLRAIISAATLGRAFSVNVPIDVMEAAAGDAVAQIHVERAENAPEPNPAVVAAVADLFEAGWATQKPVILAGRGAIRSGAAQELRKLGETVGALLATSLAARSFFLGDQYHIGVCGSLSSQLASELLSQADSVLVFGASLNDLQTYDGTIFPRRAQVIQIDSDRGAFGRHSAVPGICIHADARRAAAAIVDELQRRGYRSDGFRRHDVAERIRDFRPDSTFRDQSTPTTIDPRSLMIELDAILPKERTVVVELGQHMRFVSKYLGVPRPPAFIIPMESFAIGLGVGAAIGGAIGRPDRLTVLEIGDAGLMMTLGDLETAIRYKIPLIVVVSNNSALGSEVNILRSAGLPEHHAQFSTPSFAAIASAMGAEGRTIRSVQDLSWLRDRLTLPIEQPILLDCHVNPEIREDVMHRPRVTSKTR